MKLGTYVVIEGIDGCGKSTQLELLLTYLDSLGHKFIKTREPGSNLVGRLPFDAYKAVQDGGLSRLAIEFLLQAERAEHLVEVSRLLKSGISVISDRSALSGYSYGMANKLPGTLVEELCAVSFSVCQPDLLIWIDLPVKEAVYRLNHRGGPKSAEEKEETLTLVRRYFELFFLRRHPFHLAHIEAEGKTVKDVHELITNVVDGYFSSDVVPDSLKTELYGDDGII